MTNAAASLERSAIEDAAARLLAAYYTGEPIPPLIERYPGGTSADAYRIQQQQVRAWSETGDSVRGHKIGLASLAMQRQMGVDEPDYGHLTARMFHPENEPIAAGSFLQPRIEPEIAFVLKAPLHGPGLTVADAARAVDFVLPALEIVDSRIRDWRITIFDTIADNASSGGVILGASPASLTDLDLAAAGCLLGRNGTVVETGAGAAVLGSPLNALTWLANAIGELGVRLEAGHVVLSGSMTRAIAIGAGDTLTASIAGVGSVTAVISGDVDHRR